MVGVATSIPHLTPTDKELMRDAGIQWLRSGRLGFDVEKFQGNEPQPEEFFEAREKVAGIRKEGFQVMGISPGPKQVRDVTGKPGSQEYFDNYRRICAFLREQYDGLIDYWQVANELDIWLFRDTLSMDQSVDFLKAGIRGFKQDGGAVKAGVNITLFPSLPGEVDGNTELHEGLHIAKGIYQAGDVEADYAGFDSYPGTWRAGGVESWDEYLDGFYKLTGKPIIIQEFGYSSAGELMTEEEDKSGIFPCEIKKWRFAWGGGHTPEVQARFIEEAYRIFSTKPYVLGATYFSWRDANHCWQCRKPDCPMETAWGLLDREGNLKPSYHSLKSSIQRYYKGGEPASEQAAGACV